MVLLCWSTLLFAQRSFWWSSSFLVGVNVPRKLEGWPVRALVISKNYHPAFRPTGQFLLSSSFTIEGSRVRFAVGIWYLHNCLDLGICDHNSGGLKAACVLRILAQSLGNACGFWRILHYTEAGGSPGAQQTSQTPLEVELFMEVGCFLLWLKAVASCSLSLWALSLCS